MSRTALMLAYSVPVLAGLTKRFSVSDTPTGTVDSQVIGDCTYWANVQSG